MAFIEPMYHDRPIITYLLDIIYELFICYREPSGMQRFTDDGSLYDSVEWPVSESVLYVKKTDVP